MRLEATAVSVTFHGAGSSRTRVMVPALAGVSLGVASGELVAIVGPNGSGKTTLLRTMLGLEHPQDGRVALDGRNLASYSRRQLAESIGALPQREEPAFPLTVRETLLLGRWSRLGPVAPVGPDDERAMSEALARCDVTGFENRSIDTLSGGEWQRVRLARALAATPQLLLLDEPTAALDIGHEMALFELLRRLVRDGLGVLVVTHQLNLAAQFADRLLLLDRGREVANGAPADVLDADRLAQVFEWPVSVLSSADGTPHVIPLRRSLP
jgi:iron complex transport system ATP-binding protein